MDPNFLLVRALPIVLFVLALEAYLLRRTRGMHYDWKESLCTFGVVAMGRVFNAVASVLLLDFLTWISRQRMGEIHVDSIPEWVFLFVSVDFVYYWFHRLSHRSRWLWASHAVHHSCETLQLSGAYRLGFTAGVSGGWIMFVPFLLAGVALPQVGVCFALNLLYQFWLHTELIPKLGPLEWVLNTPSQHRVHHARNEPYLDKNFGGVLSVFDRLFGTFAAETERCEYGVIPPLRSYNPVTVSFHAWLDLAHDLRREPSWRRRLALTLLPPGRTPKPGSESGRSA